MAGNDRSWDVWLLIIEIVGYWLFNMDLYSTQKFEKDLLVILLNGVSDIDHLPISVKS